MICILGIETSCDETGIAIYDKKKGLLANKIHSQITLHQKYGGIVPELASRDHIRNVIPLITKALKKSHLKPKDIHAIAYTAGPGLVGALLVGATIGCTLSYAWNIPKIPINHMEAHLLAPMLEKNKPTFPFVALLISGGHTQLINVIKMGQYQLLGESVDDAIGEAYDKTAKLLGINYPGGACLEKIAKKGKKNRFIFPRPMIDRPGMYFSFSGLKTCAANIIFENNTDPQTCSDIARAFEDAVIDVLVIKCRRALKYTGYKNLVVSGGVSANKNIRRHLTQMVKKEYRGKTFYARTDFCTDNGAMIAYTGMVRFKQSLNQSMSIEVHPKWSLLELPKI